MIDEGVLQAYINRYTEDDLAKLFRKRLDKVARKRKWAMDKECAQGKHGFNTISYPSSNGLTTHCQNCGCTWTITQ